MILINKLEINKLNCPFNTQYYYIIIITLYRDYDILQVKTKISFQKVRETAIFEISNINCIRFQYTWKTDY